MQSLALFAEILSSILVSVGKVVRVQRMTENIQNARGPAHIVPSTTDAVDSYVSSGGQLTLSNQFGCDPLSDYADHAELRSQLFTTDFPDWNVIFHGASNRDYGSFHSAVLRFVHLTKNC